MRHYILTCNAGSNSLKCALFDYESLSLAYRFSVDRIHSQANLSIENATQETVLNRQDIACGYQAALQAIVQWHHDQQAKQKSRAEIVAAGHRVVHGGREFTQAVMINTEIKEKLKKLVPLAPLHQPHNLHLIDALQHIQPELPQIACFDTAFHCTQSKVAQQFCLPYPLMENEGIFRYGFHGLSYEYIVQKTARDFPQLTGKKLLVAHLGSGASLCAIKSGKSLATTMGFSALDGLMMATRSGNIDPGVLLYLLQEKGMSVEALQNLLYKESGLLGVSGLSGDMRDLEKSSDQRAKEAIELFCFTAAKQMGGLITVMSGIDALIFTGAMGVGSRLIREKILDYLRWLNIHINHQHNSENKTLISREDSAAMVLAIKTDEEKIIAQHSKKLLGEISA